MSDLLRRTSATFSPCRTWRYVLERSWEDSRPPLVAGFLNPSTADEAKNDPTVERTERRAVMLGFGSLLLWNAFAFRATDPRDMKVAVDPIGPDNDVHITRLMRIARDRGGMMLVGWGVDGGFMGRAQQIATLARIAGVQLHCLGVTNCGQPRHPLYVSYATRPRPWRENERDV